MQRLRQALGLSGTSGSTEAGSSSSMRNRPRQSAGARPSLFDRNKPFFTGVHRFGIAKLGLYFTDPFHTLLNLPWWRFILVFFATYIIQFLTFALIYLGVSNAHTPNGEACIANINGSLAHALWMSSRTASTIGFNDIVPAPDCPGANFVVMFQVICSSLIDFCMLGLVFARFSAPFKRAASIRFSSKVTVSRHSSGFWALTFRVANIRKHQLLKPEIKMLVTAIDSITPSNYTFDYLEIEGTHMQQMNLQLGFPANVVHVIRPGSPLYNLSLQEMDSRLMELLVFVDGIDAMTSKQMQARKSYCPSDMAMNEQFVDMHLEMRSHKLGLDFSNFDATISSTEDLIREYQTAPHLKGMSMPEVQMHMSHLRHLTFKRLTEQGTPAPAAAAAGAAGMQNGGGAAAAAAGFTGGGGRGSVEMMAAGGGSSQGVTPAGMPDVRNPFSDQGSQYSHLNL